MAAFMAGFLDGVRQILGGNRAGTGSGQFLLDGLHLNAKGYELWTSVLRPYLK